MPGLFERGDTLVIRALDRIAGSEVMAIQAISELHERIEEAQNMRAQGKSIAHIAAVLGVGASSVSRALFRAGAQ